MIQWIEQCPSWLSACLLVAVILAGYAGYGYIRFQKQQKDLLALQNSLRPGDRVALSSGFLVQICSLDKKTAVVLLDEQAQVKARISRFAITQKLSDEDGEKTPNAREV